MDVTCCSIYNCEYNTFKLLLALPRWSWKHMLMCREHKIKAIRRMLSQSDGGKLPWGVIWIHNRFYMSKKHISFLLSHWDSERLLYDSTKSLLWLIHKYIHQTKILTHIYKETWIFDAIVIQKTVIQKW